MAIIAPARPSSMRIRDIVVAGIVLFLLMQNGLPALRALAQDSESSAPRTLPAAFTYQGRLVQEGIPGNGPFDFEFAVFDNPTVGQGGALGSGSKQADNVQVTNGLFTVPLDFGNGVFTGDPRWIEVRVRPGNSNGAYTTLGRQELTPTPYAMYASTVPWTGVSGIPADIADGVDDDTTYSAESPIDLEGTTFGLSTSGCAEGEVWKYVDSKWECQPDVDTNTTYTPGTGLSLNGTAFSVNFAGDGAAPTAARSDHDHFGQSWSGTAQFAGLQILNDNDDGFGVSTQVGSSTGTLAYKGNFGVVGGVGAGICSSTDLNSVFAGVFGSNCISAGVVPFADGVLGYSLAGAGVHGETISGGPSPVGTIGVLGNSGAEPPARPVNTGVMGYAKQQDGTGVYGRADGLNAVGIKGVANTSQEYAGRFFGKVEVNGTFMNPSDRSLKHDIAPLGYGLDEVLDLLPVSYIMNDDPENHVRLGLVAQDVQPLLPELVLTNAADGTLSLNYLELIPVLIRAIQEQQAEIEVLQAGGPTAAATDSNSSADGLALALGLPMLAVAGVVVASRRRAV